MRIVAIDPGMASCGVALMEHPRKLLDYDVIMTTPNRTDGKPSKSNADAIRRSREVTAFVLGFIEMAGGVDSIVLEEFVDIAKAKGGAYLWTTPMATGYLVAHLEARYPDIPICWSNPSNLPPHSKREARWAELVPVWGLWDVDGLPKTRRDHVQSAILHGIHYLEHTRIWNGPREGGHGRSGRK